MTGDRDKFINPGDGVEALTLIEGRMVHQHRVAAKRYVSGRGRRAVWDVQFPFGSSLVPQWLIRNVDLRPDVRARVNECRAGFCDITGQTNERTVLAALIPEGVVCGNKVPTVDFASGVLPSAWVGIANSFTFDWLVRRLVTTTLNFFILRSLPIPAWDCDDEHFASIGDKARILSALEREVGERDFWKLARIRAMIEVLSARLYGISVEDFDLVLRDFPQIDRAQSPIAGEVASTVTRDMVVASGEGWADEYQVDRARERVEMAKSAGSVPFVPNQHARAYGRKQ